MMLSIKEVLQKMKVLDDEGKSIPFSLSFVTYNQAKDKGGEIREYDEAIICQAEDIDNKERRDTREQGKESIHIRKNPKHRNNHTINIQVMTGGQKTSMIRKVHTMLITKFNGQKITL